MSKTYTITLSDAQDKALHVVAASAQEWIESAATHRADLAIEEIFNAEVQRKIAAGESITGTKEDIVLAADVESASDRTARLQAELEARIQSAE